MSTEEDCFPYADTFGVCDAAACIGRNSNAENMGKKGSWFSAIKRAFTVTNTSKEKSSPIGLSDKKSSKEKKKGKGILSHAETKSFIPLFREPSSIEKILGEADQFLVRPHASSEHPKPPPNLLWRPSSPKIRATSPRVSSARITSPRAISPNSAGAASSKPVLAKIAQSSVQRPEPTLRYQHFSATKIQAAYRGYLARRNFRALRGLVRLQGVVRGQNIKRQTMNAMKQMQFLVRVQTQIQSRRIQMLENQAIQHQSYRNNKELENTLSKWTLNQLPEIGHNDDWDDSMLTKEEIEARLQKKVEAIMKRERAMAYAYSHQLWKANPKSTQSPVDIRSNGFPWWWNWLERQLPPASTSQNNQIPASDITGTPPIPISGYKASSRPSANITFENHETAKPQSSMPRAKQFQTPTKTPPPTNCSGLNKNSKPRGSAANASQDLTLRDDDSLVSCPPFSVPSYMNPTVSAKAKVRANSNQKERFVMTPINDSKRRFSFQIAPNISSFKWKKGSTKESASQHQPMHSVRDMSFDSAISMPAIVGRRPFNRFV